MPVTPTPAGPEDVRKDPDVQPRGDGDDMSAGAKLFASLTQSARVAGDIAEVAGVDVEEKRLEPVNLATIAGVNASVSAVQAARATSELNLTRGQAALKFADAAGTNALRLTPTLVSAIVGPAVADGAAYLMPNVIPKFKPTGNSTNDRKLKNEVGMWRGGVAAVTVGTLAGVAWLLKPDLFRRAGFISQKAIDGFTHVGSDGVMRAVPSMTRDGAFANRMTLGLVGTAATLALTNKALGEEGDGRRGWGAAAAATGVATLGSVVLAPALTRGATRSVGAAFLPQNGLLPFWKPNLQWVKEYAAKVAPLTAIPAATSASTYMDVFNDFNEITGSRSPFRR